MNGLRSSVAAPNRRPNRLLQRLQALEVIRLQVLALQDAEPDFDLVWPRGGLGQPVDLDPQRPSSGLGLFGQPLLQLLGQMGWSVVQDQRQRMDTPPQCLRDDHRQQKGLVVDESFSVPAHAVDATIRHTQPTEELQSSLPLVAGCDMNRMPSSGRLGPLLPLAGLDRGLLIGANDPHPPSQRGLRSLIDPQHRPRPLQEGVGIQDVLPGMIAPRPNPLLGQPTSHRARRDSSHVHGDQTPSNRIHAPANQRHACLPRSTAGQAGGLRPHLRGKDAGEVQAEANPQCSVSRPSGFATCAPCNRCSQLPGQSVDCSTPGGLKPATGYGLAALSPEDCCAHLPAAARTALLPVLMLSNTWA
jgi:hypothetical protein